MEFNETTDLIYAFYIDWCVQHRGSPPTLRQIKVGTGISSVSVVSHHLGKLVKKGRLENVDGRYIAVGAEWIPPSAS